MLQVQSQLPADEFAKSLKRPDELLAGVWGTERSWNYFNRRSLKAILFKSRAKGQTCLLFAVRVVDGAENKQNHFLPKRIPWKVLRKARLISRSMIERRALFCCRFSTHASRCLLVHSHFHRARKLFFQCFSLSCGKVLADKVFNLCCCCFSKAAVSLLVN